MATIFDRANDLGLAFSHCVSVGNQADLEAGDIVEYLIADDRNARHLQLRRGVQDPARIVELAGAARAAGKPWLMVKAGRTAAGRARGLLAHRQPGRQLRRAGRRSRATTGSSLMDDPDAMILAAAPMARFGCRPVRRVAIVTTSGGGGAISADRLTDAGIPLASFSPETAAGARSALHAGSGEQSGRPRRAARG